MTAGRAPALPPSIAHAAGWSSTQPGQPCRAPHTPSQLGKNPTAVITLLLSTCFLVPKPVLNSPGNLCRCPPWKLVLSHQRGWYQPQGLPAFSITLQDVTSDPIERRCSQESWLGLTLRKRQKFPVLPFLFCSCFFFRSCSLLVFIKKDPCIINIVPPSTVTIKQTPYFHTTHGLQGYR